MYRALFITFLFSLAGCYTKEEKTESAPRQSATTTVTLTDAQIKNAGITTGEPEMRDMQSVIKVNGVIDVPPENTITVSFPPGGYLKSTSLLPGMHVAKGQILAVVEDKSFVQMQEDYLTAQVKLFFSQKEYERQKLLNTTKTTSDKVFEQTTSDYQSQRIMVKALHEKLLLIGINPDKLNENNISRSVNICSPIKGYVSVVNVNPGKYVSPTDVLFELVNPDDLHLALTIFEKDVQSVRPGQKVKTYLTSDTTKTYNAEVILVGKTMDSSRSTLAHCHFTGKAPLLSPGMFVNAYIQVTSSNMLSVPEEAVVRSGDKQYIFVERKTKQFEMTPVSIGVSQNGFVAISSADIDFINKTIIKKNAYAALMKMKNTGEDE